MWAMFKKVDMAGITKGYSSLKDQLDEYFKGLEADAEEDQWTSDPSGMWREAAMRLTKDILTNVGPCLRTVASEREDDRGPLRKAMGKISGLNKDVARMEDRLRPLGRELSKAKRELMLLGRVLMMSQDSSLAANAHEMTSEAEDAIRTGQQRVRAALRRIGAASDIAETGSMDVSLPRGAAVAGGPLAGQGV